MLNSSEDDVTTRTERRTRRRTARPAPVRSTVVLLALALAAPAGAAILAARALALVADRPWDGRPAAQLPGLVELAVCAGGAGAALWLAVSAAVATVCALARSTGRRWARGERVVRAAAPALVRRALAAAVGASLGLAGVAAAGAAPPPGHVEAPVGAVVTADGGTGAGDGSAVGPDAPAVAEAADLGWRPSTADASPAPPLEHEHPSRPQAPVGAGAAPGPARSAGAHAVAAASAGDPPVAAPTAATPPRPVRQASGRTGATTVVVRPGDSLWALASGELGPRATAAQVAAEWPRWYEANRATIGADPDLLLPGQVLVVPEAQR